MIPELNRIYAGDNRATLRSWPGEFVDAVVTDPPYELGFMGKAWDSTGIAYSVELWREVLRVMKPGAHLLAFGGTRTYHRMACAIEDAGFDIRDQLQWVYGSGFPKSLDISKAIDKAAGIWRGRAGAVVTANGAMSGGNYERTEKGDPATPAPQEWQGWGTALKPANEPIVLARKPLSENTVAANVLRWGTGGLNIEAGRLGRQDGDRTDYGRDKTLPHANTTQSLGKFKEVTPYDSSAGRWPSNVLLDRYAAGFLDAKEADASRFFYVAKPDGGERNQGLEDEEAASGGEATGREDGSAGLSSPRAGAGRGGGNQNVHPTVKPVDLMSYLIQLVTPPQGIVLDPFMGSGTTGIAAARLGHPFLGCELNPEYIRIAEKRIAPELQQGKLL